MTRAGLPHLAMTFAIVKVFPEPVTPRSVWSRLPALRPFTSVSIATGWSPAGRYSLLRINLFTDQLYQNFGLFSLSFVSSSVLCRRSSPCPQAARLHAEGARARARTFYFLRSVYPYH